PLYYNLSKALILMMSSGILFWSIVQLENLFITAIIGIGMTAALIYCPKHISQAEIEATLNQNKLKIRWIRQFIFRQKSDVEISLKDIVGYYIHTEKEFSSIRITTKNDSTITIVRALDLNAKDDFYKFYEAFVNTITNHESFNTDKNEENANKLRANDT